MITEYKKMDPSKALEALVWVVQQNPGADFHNILKTIFYADKYHLHKYGRPVVGDKYKKMDFGPVASCSYDLLKKSNFCNKKMVAAVESALETRPGDPPRVYPLRAPDLSFFSETDIECLGEALEFCRDKTFKQLRALTHQEAAYQKALLNEYLDYELLVGDTPDCDEIVDTIRETAPNLVF